MGHFKIVAFIIFSVGHGCQYILGFLFRFRIGFAGESGVWSGRGRDGTGGRADGLWCDEISRVVGWWMHACRICSHRLGFGQDDIPQILGAASHVGQMVQYGTRIYDRSLRILTRTRQVYRPEKQVGHKTLNML